MTRSQERTTVIGGTLALLVLVLLFSSVAIIPAGHRGVAVTLGKVDGTARPEGFTTKLPFMTSIVKVDVRQQQGTGSALCFSSDLQTVDVQFNCLYRWPEGKVAELYQKYSGNPYDTQIEPRIQECFKRVAADYPAEQIVKKREEIRAGALAMVKTTVGDIMIVDDINIVNIDLSDELESAIEAKMVQEQQALAKEFELRKEQKNAEIVLVKAKAEAEAVRITGEALTASPKMIELEVVKKWNGVAPTTVVVGSGASGAEIVFPVGDRK